MKKIGDYVVYRKQVCKIIDLKQKGENKEDYYVLTPISDNSLIISIPVLNSDEYLRDIISQEEVEEIIKKIPEIKPLEEKSKFLENEYKSLLASGTHEDLIKIIKTSYMRNQNRMNQKKKLSDKDKQYFTLAESYLYNEFSIALSLSYEDTKNYVINKVMLEKDKKSS